jgi:hypothetical protein
MSAQLFGQLARVADSSARWLKKGQPVEGGKVRPSTDALERFAQATRTRLQIVFEPQRPR